MRKAPKMASPLAIRRHQVLAIGLKSPKPKVENVTMLKYMDCQNVAEGGSDGAPVAAPTPSPVGLSTTALPAAKTAPKPSMTKNDMTAIREGLSKYPQIQRITTRLCLKTGFSGGVA